MWVPQKKIDEFKATAAALQAEIEQLKKRPYLIGIERSGRLNKFTWAIGNEVYVVETMGLISDAIGEWKQKLLP
jgi:hypothetical protein